MSKRIEAGWQLYLAKVIPPGASEVQINENAERLLCWRVSAGDNHGRAWPGGRTQRR
jgi:hypothetical protein